jgi:hypothetical protein
VLLLWSYLPPLLLCLVYMLVKWSHALPLVHIYTISITRFNLASGQLLTTKIDTLTEGIVCDISKYCKSKPGRYFFVLQSLCLARFSLEHIRYQLHIAALYVGCCPSMVK